MTPTARLLLCVVLAATAAVYVQTLGYDFVYDDPRQIEMSASRFTWSQAPGYFTTDVWDYVNRRTGNYYRPVFLVWLLINYQLFGLSHPLWHASTIALHLAATILLFFWRGSSRVMMSRLRSRRCCSGCIRPTSKPSPGLAA